MKTLLRLCSAAVLAATVTACGEVPTAANTDIPPARRDGGLMGGGGHATVAGDTVTVNTVSGDQTTSETGCVEERGGVTIGGGHFIGAPACE